MDHIKLETGDIIFLSRRSIIVCFMSLFQSDPVIWGHVLVVKDNEKAWEANAHRIEEIDVWERIDNAPAYKIIRHTELTETQKETMRSEAPKLLGLEYGFWRIFLQFFDHIFGTNWFTSKEESENIQVCSSYVAWIYDKACDYHFNDVTWASCDPDDIEDESIKCPDKWIVIVENGVETVK